VSTLRILRQIVLAALPAAMWGQTGGSGTTIPTISGVVFDAASGKPVSGIDVDLEGDLLRGGFGDNGNEPFREEHSTTLADGSFSFPAKVEAMAALPLVSVTGLSLAVNASPGSVRNPTGSILNFPQKSSYFSMSVQLISDCVGLWNAACISLPPMGEHRIPLIPVVDDPAQCKNIGNAQWREMCRQLNTYRAAFLHLGTLNEIQNDKKICRSVDQGPGSVDCLNRLRGRARTGSVPQRAHEPAENVLIRSVPGLVAHSPMIRFDPFDDAFNYQIAYAAGGVPSDQLASVTVSMKAWQPTDEDVATWVELHQPLPVASSKTGFFEGHRVSFAEGASALTWSSGNNIVTVDFGVLTMIPLPLEIRRALIRVYMQKFPVSN
jgi:hypothetical protein